MDYLDIFYNYIVKEAKDGKVSCFLGYSILFETSIEEIGLRTKCTKEFDDVIIPILTIKNKELFDKLLCKYVDMCLDFYGTNNFREEVLNCEDYETNRTCPEKLIMAYLWANATYDDFLEPEKYLEKRIAFLENRIDNFTTNYSPILNGYIDFKIEKDNILFETPYKIVISSKNEDGEDYSFPTIRFGIYNNTVYIYTIQSEIRKDNSYSKKVNRSLYKVNDGFNDNGTGLKDVSSSFVVALNMVINYFYSLGYRDFNASSILITRWNAKKIVLQNKLQKKRITEEEKDEMLKKHDIIQRNLTDKFLNTFLRIISQYEGINVTSLPFDVDSFLHIKLNDEIKTDNPLLNETSELIKCRESVKSL